VLVVCCGAWGTKDGAVRAQEFFTKSRRVTIPILVEKIKDIEGKSGLQIISSDMFYDPFMKGQVFFSCFYKFC